MRSQRIASKRTAARRAVTGGSGEAVAPGPPPPARARRHGPAWSPGPLAAEEAPAREPRLGAERLFDAQQLVVLGHAVRARRRPGLDLGAARGDREVGDGLVLGLARAVRHRRRVARLARRAR